jgi:hypothetical protein
VLQVPRRIAPALAGLLGLLMLAGCGGGGSGGASYEKGGPAAPADCLQSWNQSQTAPSLGKHSYLSHQARGGQMYHFTNRGGPGFVNRCVVFFAVRPGDYEYGIVAAADYPDGGWDYVSVTGLPPEKPEDLPNMQRRAAQQANVKLDSSGQLTPL